MYLLDTNICIFAINRRKADLLETIRERSKEGLYVSSLTVAELEYGVENSMHKEGNRIALLKFLSIFGILGFDHSDAIPYGRLKARLRKEGRLIGPIDMLLAAQALSGNLTLVTNNVSEFSRIEGLIIEDWSRRGG